MLELLIKIFWNKQIRRGIVWKSRDYICTKGRTRWDKKKLIDNEKVHNKYNLKIYECKNSKVTCFLVESGMGKVNAARSTQILIDSMNVDYILNVGVAGSISKKINICDIVIGDKLVQHDFDFTLFNYEKGEIPGIGKYINCNKNLIDIAKKLK